MIKYDKLINRLGFRLGTIYKKLMNYDDWEIKYKILADKREEIDEIVYEIIECAPPEIAFEVIDGIKSILFTQMLWDVRLKKAINQKKYDQYFQESGIKMRELMRKGEKVNVICSSCSLDDISFHANLSKGTVVANFFVIYDKVYLLYLWGKDTRPKVGKIVFSSEECKLFKDLESWFLRDNKRQILDNEVEVENNINNILHVIGGAFTKITQIVPNCNHLTIVPHKGLHFLPLQASIVETTKGMKVPLFSIVPQITYAPSMTFNVNLALAIGRNFQRPPLKFCVTMNPKNSGICEGENIFWKQIFSSDKFEDIKKVVHTKKDFLSLSKESTLLHFACHGKSDPMDYKKSSLQIGSDILSFKEILDINLLGCLNVTLGACETGTTWAKGITIDEYAGLDLSFILAGSSSVVSTLWAISDAAATIFSLFYHPQILLGFRSPCYALHQFQIGLWSGKWKQWVENEIKKENESNVPNVKLLEYLNTLKYIPQNAITWKDWAAWKILGFGNLSICNDYSFEGIKNMRAMMTPST